MRALAPLLLLLPLAVGCAEDQGTVLRVFAASSLTAPFEELAADFEADHPGVDVQLSFAGSPDVVAQVRAGAPADVVATAEVGLLDPLVDDGLVGTPREFASNALTIAVPRGNPADVQGLADLADADADLDLVVCAPEVPCGAAAQRVAEVEGLDLSPVSEERSVTDVLGKVTSGQADAGLVYATDVEAAGDAVEEVPLPRPGQSVVAYPIATVASSEYPGLAEAFVDLVVGPGGAEVLDDAGFGDPP